MSYFSNVCNKCGEGCKCVSVTVPEQTAILDKLQLLQLQLDELKQNIEREVTRRVKSTLESSADLKLEVRNLRDELTDLRASNKAVTAEREHLKQQLADEAQKNERGLADAEKQVAFYRLAADKLDRLLEIILEYGADESDDIAGFIERLGSERNKLKGELVDVRSALSAVSQERDSLRITLDAWEEADTKPIVKVEVADHVAPPVMDAGEPGHTAELPAAPVPCADVPLCMTCHECGSALVNCSQGTNHHDCSSLRCPRTCTGRHGGGWSPYSGPCKSATPVRHE